MKITLNSQKDVILAPQQMTLQSNIAANTRDTQLYSLEFEVMKMKQTLLELSKRPKMREEETQTCIKTKSVELQTEIASLSKATQIQFQAETVGCQTTSKPLKYLATQTSSEQSPIERKQIDFTSSLLTKDDWMFFNQETVPSAGNSRQNSVGESSATQSDLPEAILQEAAPFKKKTVKKKNHGRWKGWAYVPIQEPLQLVAEYAGAPRRAHLLAHEKLKTMH